MCRYKRKGWGWGAVTPHPEPFPLSIYFSYSSELPDTLQALLLIMEWSGYNQVWSRLGLPVANRGTLGLRIILEGLRSPVRLSRDSHQPLGRAKISSEGKEGAWCLGLNEKPPCTGPNRKELILQVPGTDIPFPSATIRFRVLLSRFPYTGCFSV